MTHQRCHLAGAFLQPFSLQRIFPDLACAPLGPLTPNLGQKCAQERLAGGIFEKPSNLEPPMANSTEVTKMKRIPQPNYSLSSPMQEDALRVTWSLPEASGAAAADRRLLASTPASEPR